MLQGAYRFLRPDVAGEALRSMDRLFSWPVVVTAITVAIAEIIVAAREDDFVPKAAQKPLEEAARSQAAR